MITNHSIIERFAEKGEKTGWTYIFISAEQAEQMNPGVKKSYRVKGKIDQVNIEFISILPMGEGNFILPLKSTLLKKIKKPVGEKVHLQIEYDDREFEMNEDLMTCLEEVPLANDKFLAMPKSHQRYYSNYVNDAKTEATKAKRIAKIIDSMIRNLSFAEMLKSK